MIHLLYERNIPLDLEKTIANKDNQLIVRTGVTFTEPIKYDRGIRRYGDSLSPPYELDHQEC